MQTIEQPVAHVGDLSDGQMKQVRVGETDVLLLRHEGEYYALGAECPHYGAPLAEGTLLNGRAMAGHDVSFRGVPFFWTRQFGVSLKVAGCAPEWDEVLMTGDPDERDFTAFYVRDNRPVAAAGTQKDQIAAFMGRMRTGELPPADALRGRTSVDLLDALKQEAAAATGS